MFNRRLSGRAGQRTGQKGFAAVLIGAMALTMLSGCGKSSNPAESMKERFSQYVDLGEIEGIRYTAEETQVKDTDVESKIQQWLMGYSEKIKKTTGVAVQGDTVGIDYVGRIDGVEFEGGSTGGNGTEITLGSSGYVDNFDEQIEGHEPGQTFNVEVTFPEDYKTESLRGKPAVFETTLNYISTTQVPEFTDEFVAEKTEYKTKEEYRQHVQEELVKETAENDLATDKENILQEAIDMAAVKELPEKEMKEKIEQLTKRISVAAASYNISLDQYLMYFGYTADSFQEEIRNTVEKTVKQKMIVSAIAAKADISVTKAEAEEKTQELLKASGLKDVSDLNVQYGYSNDDYYYIVLEGKVVDYLYANAVNLRGQEDSGSETASTEEASTEEAGSTEALPNLLDDPTTEGETEAAAE